MLEVESLHKRFGQHVAVDNISFQVKKGDAFGLLGPNGAGKSTTLSMMTGLLIPNSGEVRLDGHRLKDEPKYLKQRMGLVPQSIALYENLTAEENLRFWGQIYGVTGAKLRDNLDWCLQVAGLTEHRKQLAKRFSGGMQRRLNIAVAMIHRPEILIMDEPTVGIDPQSRNHILETVKTLNREGMTVIYTSHYMEEVQYLCQRLAIMDNGELIAYGNLEDVRQLAGARSTITMQLSGEIGDLTRQLEHDMTFQNVQVEGDTLVFQAQNAAVAVSRAVSIIANQSCELQKIDVAQPNLESAFLHLTGRRLRDSVGEAGDQG
ncbi:ABC transporter ATP-binding protein [Alicyclobacillus ferrooxydans]|uniref:Antibiotic ABC transporter ATP-binding protein n=1 Tax=Alicyclobacillus ferrooxydans TaxID=471514 RepID=A0A0P9EK03_9BACL|nr:ABC transporter ATP-binding protein [Alicyclobacillus ferrooxydans]KPV43369.1 antibiotic ABC transporter ATP-binding protein [Alicyclobacillus ferrooxydans]